MERYVRTDPGRQVCTPCVLNDSGVGRRGTPVACPRLTAVVTGTPPACPYVRIGR